MSKFKHVISLGYDCNVALELEKNGLRDSSSPFDWVTTIEFEHLITLIEKDFIDFLNPEFLCQDKEKNVYYNKKYNIGFFHDFNSYEDLSNQLPKVFKKYQRRIDRFYSNIKEPTLFVRYIFKATELKYIEENINQIRTILKSANTNNEIIFLSSEDLDSTVIKLYKIKREYKNNLKTIPITSNTELESKSKNNAYYSQKKKEKNYEKYIKKNKFSFLKKIQLEIKKYFSR